MQVVIALIVTPEGFPLAYEVRAGNTSDQTTLWAVLQTIETQYGKARRIWVRDRGIPTAEGLDLRRRREPPVQSLVGTPKGRLSVLEQALVDQPWHTARQGVPVKLVPQDGELSVLAESVDRVAKERAMRRRQLTGRWKRLRALQGMRLTREALLMKLGAARAQAPSAWRLVEVVVADEGAAFTYRLRKDNLRQARRRAGRSLLRTNLTETDPATWWTCYLQRVAVEQAVRNLKGAPALRPISHQDAERIEAHIFVSCLAYGLHVTLGRRRRDLAPGLTSRSVLEKFVAIQMIDVHVPTTDGREVRLRRYTPPEPELRVLLEQLKLTLPAQPPPQITTAAAQRVLSV